MTLVEILAQAAPTTSTTQPVEPPFPLNIIMQPGFMLILMLILMWMFVFRPRKQQEKQRQQMLDTLKKGDRIQTIGGILGTVVEVRETEVVVKVDETSQTRIHFNRSAIHRVVEEDKSGSK